MANKDLIRRSDELWVFGEISDGVQKEIDLAKALSMPVLYFAVECPSCEFRQVSESDLKMID